MVSNNVKISQFSVNKNGQLVETFIGQNGELYTHVLNCVIEDYFKGYTFSYHPKYVSVGIHFQKY